MRKLVGTGLMILCFFVRLSAQEQPPVQNQSPSLIGKKVCAVHSLSGATEIGILVRFEPGKGFTVIN